MGFGYRELLTTDPDAARRFWGELLDLSFAPVEEGYAHLLHRGRRVGGLVRAPAGLGSHWQSHVTVDDPAEVDRIAARAEAAGGRVVAGPAALPGVGRFAVVVDPDGARLGALHAAPVEAPFSWETLTFRDRERVGAFYGAVFGFSTVALPGVELIATADGRRIADLQPATTHPPRWLTYAAVERLERALATTTRLGGQVVVPRFEVHGFGAIAFVAGTDGARLGLVERA